MEEEKQQGKVTVTWLTNEEALRKFGQSMMVVGRVPSPPRDGSNPLKEGSIMGKHTDGGWLKEDDPIFSEGITVRKVDSGEERAEQEEGEED